MCGWVGVEISKSRVRTPGKAGYGLYRVRTAAERHWHVPHPKIGPDGEWTAYAFTLDMIRICVEDAIQAGTPDGPGSLLPRAYGHGWSDPPDAAVPTRWTPQYQGRRDLGVRDEFGPGPEVAPGASLGEQPHDGAHCHAQGRPHLGPCVDEGEAVPVRVRPEFAAELDALVPLVDEGLVVMRHVGDGTCSCRGTASITAACARLTMGDPREVKRETLKSRQRQANAQFQREHKERRAVGLERRHARKLSLGKRRGVEGD